MKNLIRRLLPEPVVRFLKPIYHFFIRVGGWFRRVTRRWWRALRIALGMEDEATLVLRDRVGSAREDRGTVRAQLREVRHELRKTKRSLAMARGRGGDFGDTWWEQQHALSDGKTAPHDLAYFPGGAQNPYLRLLYSGCAERGFTARSLDAYELLERAPGSSVFHLHWTRIFQAGAETQEAASEQTAKGLDRLEAFLGRGGRLLWSVHEWLPHDCEFPEVEVGLRRRLVELASGVHVLHGSTVGEVEGLYPLVAERTFVVEHPLYSGVYPDYVSRAAARRMLGVDDDEVVLLGFGAIRPYKGFDRLVRAVPRLREVTGERIRVMLAGPTYPSVENRELLDLVAATDGVSMTDRAVPDEYVQVLFRAADVVVLPYRQVLNSGVLMLALTFGCPSVAPENPVTLDAVGSGLVHVFDRESDEGLVDAVVAAIGRRDQRGVLPDAFTKRFDHRMIANQFASELVARTGETDAS